MPEKAKEWIGSALIKTLVGVLLGLIGLSIQQVYKAENELDKIVVQHQSFLKDEYTKNKSAKDYLNLVRETELRTHTRLQYFNGDWVKPGWFSTAVHQKEARDISIAAQRSAAEDLARVRSYSAERTGLEATYHVLTIRTLTKEIEMWNAVNVLATSPEAKNQSAFDDWLKTVMELSSAYSQARDPAVLNLSDWNERQARIQRNLDQFYEQ